MEREALEAYRLAGRIAARALAYGATLIKPGALIREVLDKIESFIIKEGGEIAFPAQVSLNHVAAHDCPAEDDERAFTTEDLVKLDVGAHVNGYVGDNALTINLDEENEEKERLVEAARAARDAAIAIIKEGVTLDEIGRVIKEEITKRGFAPITNLSGHGLGQYELHAPPNIPNYPTGEQKTLRAGTVVAIEPFATTGEGAIYTSTNPTIFALTSTRKPRSPLARQLLTRLEEYRGLPFTTRWLTREFGKGRARLGLLQLKGWLREYPPLPEKSGGLVSQSEHTILVEEDGCTILTRA